MNANITLQGKETVAFFRHELGRMSTELGLVNCLDVGCHPPTIQTKKKKAEEGHNLLILLQKSHVSVHSTATLMSAVINKSSLLNVRIGNCFFICRVWGTSPTCPLPRSESCRGHPAVFSPWFIRTLCCVLTRRLGRKSLEALTLTFVFSHTAPPKNVRRFSASSEANSSTGVKSLFLWVYQDLKKSHMPVV